MKSLKTGQNILYNIRKTGQNILKSIVKTGQNDIQYTWRYEFMFRKESITIKEWIESSDKALLVTGARQIGKTWLIRDEIDKSGFKRFEINFIDQPDMIDFLNTEISAEDFLVKLKMIMPEEYKPHKTVVFFDEIQKCPEIVTKIKFLVDEGSFKYAMSGSLLGVELKGIASAPVGYLSITRCIQWILKSL